MNQSLKNLAIKASINQDWTKAISLNTQLLEIEPSDIAALNRLGNAHMRLGDLKSAKETYLQVTKLDKYNPIAKKSLERLARLNTSSIKNHTGGSAKFSTSFIEEPGRTKSVNLIRAANQKDLVNLLIGTQVQLIPKKKRIYVETESQLYLGTLPDDIGMRLEKLLRLGCSYEAYIKTVNQKEITIFIRETCKSPQAKNTPSFVSGNSSNYTTLESKAVFVETVPIDVTPTGEDEAYADR